MEPGQSAAHNGTNICNVHPRELGSILKSAASSVIKAGNLSDYVSPLLRHYLNILENLDVQPLTNITNKSGFNVVKLNFLAGSQKTCNGDY